MQGRAMPAANRPRVAVRVVRADGGPESVIPMRGDVMLCGRTGDLAIADDPFVARGHFALGAQAGEDPVAAADVFHGEARP